MEKVCSLPQKTAMKILLLFTAMLLFYSASGHEITGYVYDHQQQKPLQGASVYLDGTTHSATTNAEGFFIIVTAHKYNSPLIVSFVGFNNEKIEKPYAQNMPLKIFLKVKVNNMNELVISKKRGPFTREEMLIAFRKQFLGISETAATCIIENEDDVNLYYDTKTKTLHGSSPNPLQIRNSRLEYDITFQLEDFKTSYNTVSLSERQVKSNYYAGSTLFKDISRNGSADSIRKKTYQGSTAHLMKTIASKDWEKQKFKLNVYNFPDKPDKYFAVSDSLHYKKITLTDIPAQAQRERAIARDSGINIGKGYSDVVFGVVFDKTQRSGFTFNKGHFYVDENGLYFPLTELRFGGYIGSLRAGDLLPVDYRYEE